MYRPCVVATDLSISISKTALSGTRIWAIIVPCLSSWNYEMFLHLIFFRLAGQQREACLFVPSVSICYCVLFRVIAKHRQATPQRNKLIKIASWKTRPGRPEGAHAGIRRTCDPLRELNPGRRCCEAAALTAHAVIYLEKNRSDTITLVSI